MIDPDCDCGYDPMISLYMCFSGFIYGPCEDENCGGSCEFKGECECQCHATTAAPSSPARG